MPIILLNPILKVNSRFHFFQLWCFQIKKSTVNPALTATSLQWSLSNLPKVAVVEIFNCRYIDECCIKTPPSYVKTQELKNEIA